MTGASGRGRGSSTAAATAAAAEATRLPSTKRWPSCCSSWAALRTRARSQSLARVGRAPLAHHHPSCCGVAAAGRVRRALMSPPSARRRSAARRCHRCWWPVSGSARLPRSGTAMWWRAHRRRHRLRSRRHHGERTRAPMRRCVTARVAPLRPAGGRSPCCSPSSVPPSAWSKRTARKRRCQT
jgi:hypothetical protein